MEHVLRRPLQLAALADAAVPGLMPIQVEGLPVSPGAPYQRALLTDEDGRTWTVRSALSPSAAAALDRTASLARLLRPRVAFSLPNPAGIVRLPDGAAVAVHRTPAGEQPEFDALPARSAQARAIGSTIAAVHDLDPRVFEEAGLPSYDAEECRTRRLAELDLAAATGRVPAGLLARWEHALEDVALWRFAAVPVHGPIEEDDLLLQGEEVVALDGWHQAQVGDPAVDFTHIFLHCDQAARDTVIETYATARRDRPDTNLERRIRLAAELHLVTELMTAVQGSDEAGVERQAQLLRRLDTSTADDDSLTPPPVARRTPAAVDVDPDDVEEVALDAPDDEETLEIPVAVRDPHPAPAESVSGSTRLPTDAGNSAPDDVDEAADEGDQDDTDVPVSPAEPDAAGDPHVADGRDDDDQSDDVNTTDGSQEPDGHDGPDRGRTDQPR